MLLILFPFHIWARWGHLICKTILFVEFNECPWLRQQHVCGSFSDKGALLCPWIRQWEERTYTNILKDLDQSCWLFTKPKASVLTVVILQKCAQNRWFRPVYRMIYRVKSQISCSVSLWLLSSWYFLCRACLFHLQVQMICSSMKGTYLVLVLFLISQVGIQGLSNTDF